MPGYSQADRPIRVTTPLGEDALLLAAFSGVEGVSMPFELRLSMLSDDAAVSAADLLRQPVAITLRLADDSERTLHGLVRRFVQQGTAEALTAYQAEVVPWLWFLSLSHESRIYQNLTTLQIVEQVFRDRGFADFESRCTKAYPTREFCVQYRETHLDFVSRLLEEEGIFYFFEHSADRHLLVLADAGSAVQPCPEMPAARMAPQAAAGGDDVVTSLHMEESAVVGKVVLKDYDFLQPSLNLESSISAADPEEFYDYPGEFAAPDEGERRARIRLEAAGALRQVIRGQSTCRGFASGFRFDLAEHPRPDTNQAYMLLQVQHTASAGDFRSSTGGAPGYRNQFLAIPHAVPFRPPPVTPHPVVHGSQTALVVGPAGEEVWVDSHGRIKVQFYWDRVGKKDENSSCWVRVAQPWAGKGWGAVQIPRIGNEVVVEFLEGDPDRPLVTGSVYNAEQTPPFELPGAGIQMGMKSRSSKGGGGYNEITLTDTRGTELITIHGQYDMDTAVEHDQRLTVGNDESISVGANETVSVGKNRSTSVGTDDSLSVGGNRSSSIDKDDSLDVTGNRSVSVGKDESVEVSGKRTVAVTREEALSVGEKRTVEVDKDDLLKVGKKLVIDAGDEITIKTGKASIVMKKDGTITIKGKDIKVDASGKINGKASGDIVLKGAKVLQN
jgi:type VI secretion system secreted protein VgrG